MSMQQAQAAFIAESRELLAEMETALLRLERPGEDAEAINAVFRAAHTIKGTAGVFGLDPIVGFTHVVESLLELVRSGNLRVEPELVGLLLSAADHMGALIGVAEGVVAASPEISQAGDTLVAQLSVYIDSVEAKPLATTPLPPAESQPHLDRDVPTAVASDTWHVSLRFGPDTLRHGLEPLSLLAYLEMLGQIVAVSTIFDSLPAADAMDPESCYLGLELDFRGAVQKETLEAAFEFVRDDCAIRILPPHSLVADYIALIEQLPEDTRRLGELLVSSGALTQRELDEGLRTQSTIDGPAPVTEHVRKLGEILVGQGVVQGEVVHAALDKQRAVKEKRAADSNFMRVRADKLDELITLVGELVIAGAGAHTLARRAGNGDLVEATATLERLVEDMRDRALRLRMVPIAETFGRFNRVVRDLSLELGKQVELVLNGTETEVDKAMADKIIDPLTHLVRNAMDHGIESPELRRARGKPPEGRVTLNAYHESGSIVVEVGDDGGGLDRRRILARAMERGLVADQENLRDEDVWSLVMQAGFSTAETITSVSGRGIGMDVVRRNVEALRGSVSISSREGSGTIVSMRLPLTLAIIDGFSVGVGRSVYVMPLETVVECLELPATEREAIRTRSYINLRGEVLPLLRLRDAFEAPGEASRRENIVVVQYGNKRAGFVVDSLLGEFQAVIKPLGKLFESVSGISGSTILGSGEVGLILDVQKLVQRAIARESSSQGASPVLLQEQETRKQLL